MVEPHGPSLRRCERRDSAAGASERIPTITRHYHPATSPSEEIPLVVRRMVKRRRRGKEAKGPKVARSEGGNGGKGGRAKAAKVAKAARVAKLQGWQRQGG